MMPQTEAGSTGHYQEKAPRSQLLPWQGERQVERTSYVLAFPTAAEGTGFCLKWLGVDGEPAFFGSPSTIKIKRELNGLLQQDRTCGKAERHRENELLQAPEWETSKPLYTHKRREGASSENLWEMPRISNWADWWRSCPVQSQTMKTRRGSCYFKGKTQQKIRHTKRK